jgi:aspartate/methionine/tyrosine aminotransferase
MEIGRPDFDTPTHIKEAAVQALNAGQVHYGSNLGIPELRQAIAEKLTRENGMQVDPEGGVVVTVGCTEAVLNTFSAYVSRGDEVIVPEPSWLEYAHAVRFLDGCPVSVPLRPEKKFVLDPEDVALRITPRTKMLILCSPHNPTGAVLDLATLEALAELCAEHDLLVLSDEIYEKIIYDSVEHISIGSLPGMFERAITVNGFSKAYAMDGWRLGYAAGAKSLIQPILKAHQYTTTCANTFAQFGAVAAYRGSQEQVARMVREFERRRRFLVQALNDIPGVSCVTPHGAFYTFPTFQGYDLDSVELATYLLREAHIACVPGTAFGASGEGHVRMAYSTDYDSIEAGIWRMRAALARLRKC